MSTSFYSEKGKRSFSFILEEHVTFTKLPVTLSIRFQSVNSCLQPVKAKWNLFEENYLFA